MCSKNFVDLHGLIKQRELRGSSYMGGVARIVSSRQSAFITVSHMLDWRF